MMLDVFLNYACQAKCAFCFNPPLTDELVRWRLPLETLAERLLREVKRGCTGVTFSGGEVTLLKDLPKMLRLARKAGCKDLGIITNALRLDDPGYLAELREAGLTFACVSIHGSTPALHDRMVAVDGAFDKVLRALDNLEAARLPTVLNFVLTARNHKDAPRFLERFGARAQVREFQLYAPHYDGLMREHADALGIKLRALVPTLSAAAAVARGLGIEERVFVYNIPPCAVPAHLRPRLRNWEREEDSLLLDPQGVSETALGQERRDRFKNDQCKQCTLRERCLGFERGYVARFGEGELSAIR